MIYDNILQTIGNTPVVRLNRMGPDHVTMYVKVESFNPMASVKDRLAFAIINDAEQKGTLKPGQTVIEATSGNTGIALAMVCAAKGHPFVATMADSFSVERRQVMRGLGAKVILTPAAERGTGMVKKAEELAEKHGWFLARQFENPANPEYHANTTGPEILSDFSGQRLDYWVTGYGTGRHDDRCRQGRSRRRVRTSDRGDRTGGAALLAGAEWAPHKIQGWTPDFIPDVLDREVLRSSCVPISDDRSIEVSRELAAQGRHLYRVFRLVPPWQRRWMLRRKRTRRSRNPGHVAGHRGALPVHAAVRGRQRGFRRRVAWRPVVPEPGRGAGWLDLVQICPFGRFFDAITVSAET